MKKLLLWLCIAVLASLGFAVVARGEACPARPDLGDKTRSYMGQYENFAYGFATRIPAGLTGLDSDDPSYQRGFTIALPNDGGSIWVYAETNSADFSAAQAAARSSIHDLGLRAKLAAPAIYTPLQIGGHQAERAIASFRCGNDAAAYGYTAILALSADRRFVYNILWEGRLRDQKSAAAVLQALEASWKFLVPR